MSISRCFMSFPPCLAPFTTCKCLNSPCIQVALLAIGCFAISFACSYPTSYLTHRNLIIGGSCSLALGVIGCGCASKWWHRSKDTSFEPLEPPGEGVSSVDNTSACETQPLPVIGEDEDPEAVILLPRPQL